MESFSVDFLIRSLQTKAKEITSNKLERFIKEEIQKPNTVSALLSELRIQKPLLYKQVEPTELQLTFFVKSNAKKIKDALMRMGSVKPSPFKNTEETTESKAVDVVKTESFKLNPKPVLKTTSSILPQKVIKPSVSD